MNFPQPLSAETFVRAAVRVVLPWSTWPMVPTFTCGLLRSNFSLAIVANLRFSYAGLAGHLCNHFIGHGLRRRLVGVELHRVAGPPLRHGTNLRGVAEHLRQRH